MAVKKQSREIVPIDAVKFKADELSLLKKTFIDVRDELIDNQYIQESLNVLSVKGYRSAIGSYWNAVVDDLRNKIFHRSLHLFNKEINLKKEVKTYEDFQDHVTDHDLIEGAYKIGVIGWEAKKILHHCREIRNIFDGHPKSSNPSFIKVLDMISDCNKYVLNEEYPPAIIDIDEYIETLDSPDFDKNEISIEQALSDLPEVYKTELINRFFSAYIDEDTSTQLRSNIEFTLPILWSVLAKGDRHQIGKRYDKLISSGDKKKISKGTDFLAKVDGLSYTSTASRRRIFAPIIKELNRSLDDWETEAKLVMRLERLGTNIPDDLVENYVSALTQTFVGYKGMSHRFSRSSFYSDGAAPSIKQLFESFDDKAADAFIEAIKNNEILRKRIHGPGQLNRLRILGNIILNRSKLRKDIKEFLELLVDEKNINKFLRKAGL